MKKILIVEDNEKNMYFMNFLLKKNNYEVIKAASGNVGVRIALEESPDLILMDIQLPDIDGLKAAGLIRESEADKKIPIIAVTSYTMSGDRERLIRDGFTGYVEKPINIKDFLSEIKKYL
ncbi:MAG: response regulator [Actinomycetota bacterium]|nr:response regulator [Actinomycetota bacterium]